MPSLHSAGRMFLTACGSTIICMVISEVSPRERPASDCPRSTDWMPPRMTSETYAPELMPKAAQHTASLLGNPAMMMKAMIVSWMASGVPRISET